MSATKPSNAPTRLRRGETFEGLIETLAYGGRGIARPDGYVVFVNGGLPGDTVRAGDFTWLEHALLFLYKAPADYGAKLSNGLYYALEKTEDGLVGRPMAVDLNDIAAPPQDPSVPPFDQAARADIVPGARWIEALVIR